MPPPTPKHSAIFRPQAHRRHPLPAACSFWLTASHAQPLQSTNPLFSHDPSWPLSSDVGSPTVDGSTGENGTGV